MSINADISLASERLNLAVTVLEDSLQKILLRLEALERQTTQAAEFRSEAEAFKADRVALARQLDDRTAEAEQLQQRAVEFQNKETEFNALAKETAQELERVIGQVRKAMATTQDGGI